MNNPFSQTFDELLNAILTDYQNQVDPDTGQPIDVAKGSLAFVKGAVMASVSWGMYQAIAWTGDQIFPDTASQENLYRHGASDGVVPLAGESAAAYLGRVQLFEQKPLAGGNRYDYAKWALEVTGVYAAYPYPIARGTGTVDVVITTDPASGSEVPSSDLCTLVKARIDDQRPVGRGDDAVQVVGATIAVTDITMSNLSGADPAVVAADISAYLAAYVPDQTLYLVQLKAIAIAHGAINPLLTLPVADVVPATYHMIRPGVIDVGP